MWTWPKDGVQIGRHLVDAFEAAKGTGDWPFVEWWSKRHLVEVHETSAPQQFGVATVRDDQLPLILREGQTSGEPLEIDDDDSLLEPSYLTFFGDQIVALVRSGQAPGHRAVAGTLSLLTRVDLELDPIPHPEVAAKIQDGIHATSVDLTVAAGSVDAAAAQDDWLAAAEQLRDKTPGAQKITVRFTAETEPQKKRLRSRLIRFLSDGGLEDVSSAHARILNRDGVSEVVNLLEDDIATSVDVPRAGRTRYLLPEEAQRAAVAAFDQVNRLVTRSILLADGEEDDDEEDEE